jgi:hypothetical protein
VPHAVPAKLNGGRALVYSVEYCCGTSTVRAARVDAGSYNDAGPELESGDWEVFLEPSDMGDATLLIATGRPASWDDVTEKAGLY